jgi:type III restriction enzyme
MHLHQLLASKVDEWREQDYPCEQYPAIAEVLGFAYADGEDQQFRYLRHAQVVALETYWYLRVALDTPTIPKLYEALYPKLKDRLGAMGVSPKLFEEADYDIDALLERINTDNAFVRKHQLESLRETLSLDYPSYILALAMGAGKTILMGTIVATEFAMAQEYPDGPFVQNALIFAPGKTIIESLREIADIPFDRVLPPRMYKPFAAALKLTFTRDGDKELSGLVWGSLFNVVVTNTEKIRIQKNTARGKKKDQIAFNFSGHEDHDEEIANLRLLAIASLPHLAIFSDEAHHTYGQKLLGTWVKNKETGEDVFQEQGIKKVRRTVDYLAQETNLVVVVNTTGTPYFERQPLRDVVVWYGLGEGIRDGILKEIANNIQVFDLDGGETEDLITRIVHDFVEDYWDVRLEDGTPARMALYFPQTETMDELRPAVESALALKGIDPTTVLPVHSKSPEENKRAFYRVANDRRSPHRIILLVNMGTEGWNCPSLFATGLIRKLKTSNNFVLQAATRCLRQVPGNTHPARIYLTKDNRKILEKQLQETYGTTIKDLEKSQTERIEKDVVLRKPSLPPLLLKKKILRYRRKAEVAEQLNGINLSLPQVKYEPKAIIETWTIAEPKSGNTRMTKVETESETVHLEPETFDLYAAAALLAANYHLTPMSVLAALRKAYGSTAQVPDHHMPALSRQIEGQCSQYEEEWEELDIALALVKPEGFDVQIKDGEPVYTAKVTFAKERAHLYRLPEDLANDQVARDYSFHYEGYNLDSDPEGEYLERALNLIGEHPDNIEGVWFTGGLTDPNKTDLFAEYLGEDGRWHRYTPDFVIQRKDGKHLVVEIKNKNFKQDIDGDIENYKAGREVTSKEGRKAVALKKWEDLNPEILHYQVIFADSELETDAMDVTRKFLSNS